MINREAIEDAIVARIKETFAIIDVDVIPLPDTEEEMDVPFARGRITVAYCSSDFGDPFFAGMANVVSFSQKQEPEIQIAIESRKRRGDASIFAYLDLAERLLKGFRPIGNDPNACGKLYPAGDHHISREKGTWTHVLIMRFAADSKEPADYFTVNPPAP